MQYKKIAIKEKNNKVKSSTKDSLLDELLALKNITQEKDIEKFLNPSRSQFLSPYCFCDMERAKERIKLAIKNNEKILIWGDFDCDGVTSSAVLYKALNALGADIEVFIPDRLLHGHGLNTKELLKFVSKEKIKLVITVDCATSNVSSVNLLKSLGVDTIITDHHSTDTELPSAYCIINPQERGAIKEEINVEDITSLTYNSGSAVAYKLATALLDEVDNDNLKDELLLIASCGLIADVVPLLGENRSMVSVALDLLNTKKEKIHKGIFRLLSKNVTDRDITSYDIGFILAPRINAVGRLANARLSFEFLTTDDENKINMIISQLDNYNKIRQAKCAETYEEIKEYLEKNKDELKNPAVILINPSWHIGIIGIVASKIVEEYNKPCFLMTVDENNYARCSIRSNDVINVYQTLKENEALFEGFGGHKLAGGCSFNACDFDKVKENLLNTIKNLTSDEKRDDVLLADVELKSDEVNLEILKTLDKLEPFGENNAPPLFAMFNVKLDEFKPVGKEQNHLKLVFSSEDKKFQCVKWNEDEIKIPLGAICDIAFYPRLNTFNDTKSIQFEIIDVYSKEAAIKVNNALKLYDHRKKTGILDLISQYLDKDGLDIGIWAKTRSTKETLSKYKNIKENFIEDNKNHKGIMFFDYPSGNDEFIDIIKQIKPDKIHFMNAKIDEDIENYIKQAAGMLKYCSNRLEGAVDIAKLALVLGVSENFIQIMLEILESIETIEILDIDKIKYNKAFNWQEFKDSSMFELLKEEFEKILNYKKNLLTCEMKEIEKLIEVVI